MGDSAISKNLKQALTAFREARNLYEARQFDRARERMAEYLQKVDYQEFHRQDRRRKADSPRLWTVVIVSYDTGQDLLDCLNSVFEQQQQNFEVVLVNNGGNESIKAELKNYPLLYIETPINLLPSEGRNIGAHFASGEYLAFIDDDGLVPPDYLEHAERALNEPDVIGARGKVVPKTPGGASNSHYDLGPTSSPASFNLEGNMVIRREIFSRVKGFDPLMFGHEGHGLSARCEQVFTKSRIIYWPTLLLRHDFAQHSKLSFKRIRQTLGLDYLEYQRGLKVKEMLKEMNREPMLNMDFSLLLQLEHDDLNIKLFIDEILSVSERDDQGVQIYITKKIITSEDLKIISEYAGKAKIVFFPVESSLEKVILKNKDIKYVFIVRLGISVCKLDDIDYYGFGNFYSIGNGVYAHDEKDNIVAVKLKECDLEGIKVNTSPKEIAFKYRQGGSRCKNTISIDSRKKIIAGMASIPQRSGTLAQVIEKIKPQFDHLYIYLNGYKKVPECLKDEKITYFKSDEYGDLGARGKFFGLWKCLGDEYYFSLDDDFLYPDDYVKKMLAGLNKYNNKVCVTVHGSTFGQPLEWYFERVATFGSLRGLKEDKFINLLGSGTFACDLSMFPIKFADFFPETMCDLQLSIKARRNNIPIVAIARNEEWLKTIESDLALESGNDYWSKMIVRDTRRTNLARSINWSFGECKDYIIKMLEDNGVNIYDIDELKRMRFDCEFVLAFLNNSYPKHWDSESSQIFYVRKWQYHRKELLLAQGKLGAAKRSDILSPPEVIEIEGLKEQIVQLKNEKERIIKN